MSYEEISKIIGFIKMLDDEGIDTFVDTAKENGMTFDADYLRFILKNIRDSKT